MILKFISLVNFKSYDNIRIDFSSGINCFLGDNGVGKTNLLDAIHYLSFCKSYYNAVELDNVKYGESFFMIKGSFLNNENIDFEINASFRGKSKQFTFNNKKYDKLSTHIGKIPLVIITPLDSSIILGGGDDRRRFFDKILSQLDKDYLNQLIIYNRTLQQRNTLLKDLNPNMDLLSTYDQALSDYGNFIAMKRQECISLMIENIHYYYRYIAGIDESIDVVYKSELIDQDFKSILINNRVKDKMLKFTSSGVHRDDFVFSIKSNSLKKSGSQGQQKTFLIALKFAYFSLLKDLLNITPILLLDDLFDKLDKYRVKKIIELLEKNKFGQIFITDTSFERIHSIISTSSLNCKYLFFNKSGLYEEKFKT